MEPPRKRPFSAAEGGRTRNPYLQVPFHIKLALTPEQSQLLIGGGGVTIKSLRETTHATLKVTDRGIAYPGTDLAILVIGGEAPVVHSALAQVLPSFFTEDVFAIVPSETAGAIIGKGGEVVKGLRNNYGCQIKIHDGVGERLVQVGGEMQSVLGVLGEIMQCLEQHPELANYAHVDYPEAGAGAAPPMPPPPSQGGKGPPKGKGGGKGPQMYDPTVPAAYPEGKGMAPRAPMAPPPRAGGHPGAHPGPGVHPAAHPGAHPGAGHPIQVIMPIPVIAMGAVLGKAGSTIASLRQKTMTKITISQKEHAVDGMQTVTIEGACGSVQDAVGMIASLWAGARV